jgi:branched-chain amino acid transport system permease protein
VIINYFRLWFRYLQVEVLSVPSRVVALFFFAVLGLLPLSTDSPQVLRILILAAIYTIYAVSWDLLAGYTGQVSLGHGLFFGVTGYAAALLNLRLDLSPWATIPLGALCSVALGLIVGIPALRLRGFYLALVTLAFPIILTGLLFMFPEFTGGELGLFGVERLSSSRLIDTYIVYAVMLFSVMVMYKLTDAGSKMLRTGLVFQAIREDEIAARKAGINTVKYKLLAFSVSAFFAGTAGGLYAHFVKIVGPSNLELAFSFQAVLWVIFGGMGTIYGGVVGVYTLYPFMEILRFWPLGDELRGSFFALLLILTLMFMPEGVGVWVKDKIEVTCPRCREVNLSRRRRCRICYAELRLNGKNLEAGIDENAL